MEADAFSGDDCALCQLARRL